MSNYFRKALVRTIIVASVVSLFFTHRISSNEMIVALLLFWLLGVDEPFILAMDKAISVRRRLRFVGFGVLMMAFASLLDLGWSAVPQSWITGGAWWRAHSLYFQVPVFAVALCMVVFTIWVRHHEPKTEQPAG